MATRSSGEDPMFNIFVNQPHPRLRQSGVMHLGMSQKYGPEVSKERTLPYQVRLGETLLDGVSRKFLVIATTVVSSHDA
jgi:hypothetical protein